MASDTTNNPVWDIYNEYRTARMNVKYYGGQLRKIQRENFWVDLILALGISSDVSGFWFWHSALGGYAWKVLGAIVIILSILKPLWKYGDKIREKTAILTDYQVLDHCFQKLTILIKQKKKYDESLKQKFLELFDKKGEIINKYSSSPGIDEKLRNKCFEDVNAELPVENFYVPEE